MQFEAELPQSHFAQAAEDHIQRSDLFGHEKYALVFSQALRNQVCNGLALARARRTDQHKVLASGGSHDGRQLRRVCGKWAENLLRRVDSVQPPGLGEGRCGWVGFARRVDQVRHHWRLAQIVGAIRQVFPHQVLGKGEHRQHNVFADLPAPDIFDSAANSLPDSCYVQAGLITRQVASGNAQLQLEILPKHFDQRRIEQRFIFMLLQREP